MKDAVWSTEAVGDFVRIQRADPRAAGRIYQSVVQFLRDDTGDIKKLEGPDQQWRIRVGDWRTIFAYDDPTGRMRIVQVVNRRDAYR